MKATEGCLGLLKAACSRSFGWAWVWGLSGLRCGSGYGLFGFGFFWRGLGFVGRAAVGVWALRAFYGLRSWLCRFGVRGGGCVGRLPVLVFTTPPHLRPLPLRQVGARARSRATSKIKVKSCDEEPGLRRASTTSGKLARFPRVAGSVSAAAVGEVVRSVPHGRVVSPMEIGRASCRERVC